MMARMSVDLHMWSERVAEAGKRIYVLADETPVTRIEGSDPAFDGAEVFLKLEHLQKTGSFKLRGATNKILRLTPEEAARGVVTSSTGNHGLGVALAAQHKGIDAEVYVASQISPAKLSLIESYGARIRRAGDTPLEAEIAARAAAAQSGRTYISPYNDADVIAGQGTIAVELLRQLSHIDSVYIAVGGGGLVSGIGACLKCHSPGTKVVGCWPRNSRVMYECLRAGKIADFPEEPTLSQSTAGGVEAGSLTFELCRAVLDDTVLVSEQEIQRSMRWAHARGWPIEGAAAVAIAAYRQRAPQHQGETVVIISCGKNSSPEVLERLKAKF